MVNLKNKESKTFVFGLIVLGVGIAVMLYMTILLGQRQDWFRMGFFLFFVIGNFIFMGVKISLNIKTYTKHIEELICMGIDDSKNNKS